LKELRGMHHVTAITSSAEKIYDFFTNILGLRLVKKTINQDDINTYHLFFADDVGSAGTDMTFFDFQGSAKSIKGTDEISKTSFRVPNNNALRYWKKRFEKYKVNHLEISKLFGIEVLYFKDFDDQEYVLISDENIDGVKPGIPWKKGPIPNEFSIVGLGPIFFRVSNQKNMDLILTNFLKFRKIAEENSFSLYETGIGGNGSRVVVEETKGLMKARQGYGSVHHVAFGVDEKKDLDDWIELLNKIGAPHSGHVDRFYFKSLYTRLYPNILFEFATNGPGFIDDEESYEFLGETLALPPRFRNKRTEIEKLVRHIDTKRSDKTYEKEYL
jgi:glyoxalase family protein